MTIDIFCASCGHLILDAAECEACGWRRPPAEGGPGTQVWSADLQAKLIKPHCYPVIAGGLYCLCTEDGTLLAIRLDNGEVAWERALGDGMVTHALATDGERLFAGCEDARPIPGAGKPFLAIDARNGEDVWKFPTPAKSLSAAAYHDGVVYFSGSDGVLYALDAASGEMRWKSPLPIWGPAAPAVGSGIVCACGRERSLVAYAMEDGRRLWEFPSSTWFSGQPCVADGRVLVLCWNDHLYALDTRTGDVIWKRKGERGRGFTSPVSAADGRVYIGSRVYREKQGERREGYALLAMNGEDASEVWRFHTEKHIVAPIEATGDAVFFGSDDGVLYSLDAASGREHWRVQFKSRPVARPLVRGNVAYFGGRDGMIYALRWRLEETEKVLAPSTYRKRGDFASAAVAHALRGEFGDAADIYAERLGKKREAALLYERAGRPEKAGPLWEGLGDLRRARDAYRAAGIKPELARVLETLGETLEAARLREEMGELQEAARLYEMAGDRAKAAELYQTMGQFERVWAIWDSLGEWEKKVNLLVEAGQYSEAAAILEERGRLERAAVLYEKCGQFAKALAIRVRLEQWDKVADLAIRAGNYERAAEAYERLGNCRLAAEAWQRAADAAAASLPLDESKVAALYERACCMYDAVFEEQQMQECLRKVRRYRHLPEIAVSVRSNEAFVEHSWNALDLVVENTGFGIARDIVIVLAGKFESEPANISVPGLPPGRTKVLKVHARSLKEQYGKVPLEVRVSYCDLEGKQYDLRPVLTHVDVAQSGLFPGLKAPSVSIHINELIQPGGKKVVGDEILAGAQKGDRVEIHRGEAGATVVENGEAGSVVRIRGGAVRVRRCPDCNVPVEDPEYTHCPDCGAPLGPKLPEGGVYDG